MGNESIIRLQNTMRIIGGAMIGFCSLPIVFLGLQFLLYGVWAERGQGFFVAHGYYGDGAVLLIWGLVILALGIIPALVRKASMLWSILGFILLMLAATAIPSFRMPGDFARSAQTTVMGRTREVSAALERWAESFGHFPADQAELDRVVRELIEIDGKLLSSFAHAGQRLPYQMTYISDATGPYIHSPAVERPGTIYCAVSRDRKHVWITGTALAQAVGGKVIFVPAIEQAGPWVVEGSLDQSAELPQ